MNVHDNGNEFIGEEFQELVVSYGIKVVSIIIKNHQVNAMIGKIHLNMAYTLRTIIFG